MGQDNISPEENPNVPVRNRLGRLSIGKKPSAAGKQFMTAVWPTAHLNRNGVLTY